MHTKYLPENLKGRDHSEDLSINEKIIYEGVSKSFLTESITKYTLTTINTRSEATQSVMATKLTRITHKIAIKLQRAVPFAILAPDSQSGNILVTLRW
jgi:hypothetical protein